MMKEESESSYLFGGNAPYVEALYEQYLLNPNSVTDSWRLYFNNLSHEPGAVQDQPRLPIEKSLRALAKAPGRGFNQTALSANADLQKQVNVLRLIYAYRILGSRFADLDPLRRRGLNFEGSALDYRSYQLSAEDLTREFSVSSRFNPDNGLLPLSVIISRLKQTYCQHIGLEHMHIINTVERRWIRDRFEAELSTPAFTAQLQKHILTKLTNAETFEKYLSTKFVGQKRFSLEGGESLIPGLDYFINQAAGKGVQDIVIGMAHRGRLNVLINILGKQPKDLFDEFNEDVEIKLPSGDVKYHNGFTADIETIAEPVHISLEFNPSHLEIVNPVVEGNVRARQKRRGVEGKNLVLPILIHGDAALAGLGVNQANFNLSQTRGFSTGGTVHIVINNQIGFTTSDMRDTRSTTFCTDLAKMTDIPIIHVNGDDPEAFCYALNIALEFRMEFHKDIIVDMVCYRRLGHNEGDDPFLTQPMMYRAIKKQATTRTLYAQKLVTANIISAAAAEDMTLAFRGLLDTGKHVRQSNLGVHQYKYSQNWEQYKQTRWTSPAVTSLSKNEIKNLTAKLTAVPADFELHRTVAKIVAQRKQMGSGEIPLDWGMAETLAYASLVTQGYGVRLSGEDSGRGTFAHRHAVFHDQKREKWDGGIHIPLEHISPDQADFTVIDSILNEEAVLAYEYGFASSAPDHLTIWEAQFGDFANGAQVAIDQFITSGEAKWGRLCGLTVLLPHGYDGQGPEHSSGRLERWLQLCALNNIQIVVPSEAAQMFHVLRRQMIRPYRKPLIIFMSKRLLRYKDALSPLADFTGSSHFYPVIADTLANRARRQVKRLILCSGQVYYDLKNEREKRGLTAAVAIVRLEQLYPFPKDDFLAVLKNYEEVKEVMWVQEEPLNQGAWNQIYHYLYEYVAGHNHILSVASRPAAAAPAVGYKKLHIEQLDNLLHKAMTL